MSTATPRSISSSQSSQATTSAAACIAWKDAAAHLNETTCVRGIVANANQSGSTFFIDFDNTRTSFYGVSFDYTWDNLKGKCVEISGKITLYSGRPQIILNKKEQLKECQ
jgi:DNA/RNA endonuclease YhcR with UshA esterase domain